MTLRDWTGPRDGKRWSVWFERWGPWPVLVFKSEGELHTVLLDSDDGLDDRSDEELQRLLDEGQGSS